MSQFLAGNLRQVDGAAVSLSAIHDLWQLKETTLSKFDDFVLAVDRVISVSIDSHGTPYIANMSLSDGPHLGTRLPTHYRFLNKAA